jgi:hypothetical protein
MQGLMGAEGAIDLLKPNVSDDEARLCCADDCTQDSQCWLEGMRLISAHDSVDVMDIHENVRAHLHFGKDTRIGINIMTSCTGTGDDSRMEAFRVEPGNKLGNSAGALKHDFTPRVVIGLRKSQAIVSLYPDELESFSLTDATSQCYSAVLVGQTRASTPQLEVDHHLKSAPGWANDLTKLRNVAEVVGRRAFKLS